MTQPEARHSRRRKKTHTSPDRADLASANDALARVAYAPPVRALQYGDDRLRLHADIDAVEVSPDGRLVALGSNVETAVWTLPEGRLVARVRQAAHSLAFSRDGGTLWLAYGRVFSWTVGAPEVTQALPSADLSSPVALSPDGRTLAAGRAKFDAWEVVLFDVESRRELGAVGHDVAHLVGLSFSRDSRWLAVGGSAHAVVVDARSGGEVRRAQPQRAGRRVEVAFSPREDLLVVAAAGSDALSCFVGDEPARVLRLPFELESFGFMADGAELWVRHSLSGPVALVDVRTGALRADEVSPRGGRASVAARPGGGLVAAAYRHARVLEPGGESPLPTPPGHGSGVSSLAFSSAGALLATAGGHDKTVNLWASESGEHLRAIPGHANYVASLSLSVDDALLASGGMDGTLRLFDVSTGERRSAVPNAHDGRDLAAVAFDPAGAWLATLCRAGSVVLRDPLTGEALQELTAPSKEPGHFWAGALAWSRDGVLLASLGGRDRVVVHEVATGREVFAAKATCCGALAFAQHAPWLAYRLDGQVLVHDLASGTQRRAYDLALVECLAFDADGHLACAAFASPVCVFDPHSDAPPVTLDAEDLAAVVCFAPDGTLALGRSNGVTTRCAVPYPPPSAAAQREVLRREQSAVAREVLARLARQEGAGGYRDARAAELLDDGTTLHLSRSPHAVVLGLRVPDAGRVGLSVGIYAASAAPVSARVDADVGSSFARLAAWVRARLDRQSPAARAASAWVAAALRDERATVTRVREAEAAFELEVELREPPTHEALLALLGACLRRTRER